MLPVVHMIVDGADGCWWFVWWTAGGWVRGGPLDRDVFGHTRDAWWKLRREIWCIIMIHHDDVITWKSFLHYLPFVRGIHRWLVDSPHKGPVMGRYALLDFCEGNHRLLVDSPHWWIPLIKGQKWRILMISLLLAWKGCCTYSWVSSDNFRCHDVCVTSL